MDKEHAFIIKQIGTKIFGVPKFLSSYDAEIKYLFFRPVSK